MDRHVNESLLTAGALLAFLALLLGMLLPVFANPRMALSAHQQGIVAGILLMVFGLAWSRTGLVGRRARFTEILLTVGAYAIWFGCLLASVFGTSRATPIGGAGFGGARWQEFSVSLILMVGSACAIVGTGSLLLGLLRARRVLHSRSEV